jgi:hypothetical protein
MELECFSTAQQPAEMVPGRPQRAWMDKFLDRHPYRCLPLTMANTSGWELLCPVALTAEWNGGNHQDDVRVTVESHRQDLIQFAKSHFSHGIVTFHPGYLFRTPPGWSMWTGGPPNHVKDGIQALEGLVETDWLPFPFTMNWIFTRPGKVRFEKGEPFCFFTLVQDKALEEVQPVIRSLESEPELNGQYEAWYQQRHTFNERIYKGDPQATKESWQRFYFKGEIPDAKGEAPKSHVNKRRLKSPRLGR